MKYTAATVMERSGRTKGMDAVERLIPLEDDCMFAAVMGNRDACTGFLEALFGGRRVRDVRFVHQKEGPEVQRHMVFNPGGKSIRMDVYFEDSDAVYDIVLASTEINQRATTDSNQNGVTETNLIRREGNAGHNP